MTNLSYINLSDVWLPHDLKRNIVERVFMCDLLFQQHKNKPSLKRLVTGDGSWILYDNTQYEHSCIKDKEPLSVSKFDHTKKKVFYYKVLPQFNVLLPIR